VDLVSDPYLDQHRIDGRPVMPLACALEYAAEAAAEFQPGRLVVGFSDFRMQMGIILTGEELPLRIRLSAGDDDSDGRRIVIASGERSGRVNYEGLVRYAQRIESPGPYEIPAGLPPCPVSVAFIYRKWMFHGPLFGMIKAVTGVDERNLVAEVGVSRPAGFSPLSPEGKWLFDPGLIDGLFQLVAVWARINCDSTAFPARLGNVRRFGDHPLPPGLRAHVQILSHADDNSLIANIAVVDRQHRLRLLIENLEAVSSADFNHFGGNWPGGLRQEQKLTSFRVKP